MKSAVFALVCAFASLSVSAAPPPAPSVTVAATDIKQLQFDITPVTQVNWYELWFRANPGAQWVRYSTTPAQRPRFRIGTAVHLLDWQQARYQVKACNPSGCNSSADMLVNNLPLDALGYFKPPSPQTDQFYGFNFDISDDGGTLVVLAAEDIGRALNAPAIHVYRRTTSASGWRLEARLLPSVFDQGGGTSVDGDPLSISADGSVIAFGNWLEDEYRGAVYLFRRGSSGWRQTQRFAGGGADDKYGISVKLDPLGRQLVVSHNRVAGESRVGTLEVYKDPYDPSPLFGHVATVPTPAFDDPLWGGCRPFAVSGAGDIVRSCNNGLGTFFTQVLEATIVDPLTYTETARIPAGGDTDIDIDSGGMRLMVRVNGSQVANGIAIYRREPPATWVEDGRFTPFNGEVNHAALSGDGKFVAIGATQDRLAGRGPLFPNYQTGLRSGTVAVYERRTAGWTLRRYVKGGSQNALYSFGWAVALDQWGHTLAVGSPYDASRATGIDGDREDASAPNRGAVWLY